jgi:hypothetical protein
MSFAHATTSDTAALHAFILLLHRICSHGDVDSTTRTLMQSIMLLIKSMLCLLSTSLILSSQMAAKRAEIEVKLREMERGEAAEVLELNGLAGNELRKFTNNDMWNTSLCKITTHGRSFIERYRHLRLYVAFECSKN